jgi:REP element-mobilizing transposase RayT
MPMPKRSTRLSLFRTAESDNCYHVVLRVGRREPLANTARDRRALNKIVIDTIERFDIKLHAYCLLTNHLRALIEIDDRVLVEALRRVATRYSDHRNRLLKTTGNLFERPYAAQRVASDQDFLYLLRAIHLSPVIANKVTSPDDFPWSSHRAYVGFKSNALITTSRGLSLLAADPARARAAYHQFIAAGIATDVRHSTDGVKMQAVDDHVFSRLLTIPVDIENNVPSPESNIELSSVDTTLSADSPSESGTPRRYLSIY